MTRTTIIIAAALALTVTLPSVPVQAQSPRTFVSAAGSDSNPCSFAAPCRHFQAAVNATSAGGEVDALDPAGYGPITINQAISIEGQGWSYIAPPASGTGITINAVSGDVSIHGVSLNGVGIAGNPIGIVFNSGGSLNVQGSEIRNFGGAGIEFLPSSSSNLFVSDTLLTDCGFGALLEPSGASTVTAVFNRVEVNHNSPVDGFSILADNTTGGSITATVSESIISDNTNGIHVKSTSGQAVTKVTVFHSVVANSQFNGFIADGTNATITLAQSSVSGNVGSGWDILNSAVIQTYLDNYFNGNGTNSGSLTSIAKQ